MKINHRRKNRKRREYSGSKRFDRSCRNHGGCGYCENTRLFARHRTETIAELEFKEALDTHLNNWTDYCYDEDERICMCDLAEDMVPLCISKAWKRYVDEL